MARALPFRWRKGKRDTLSSPATYELRRAGELFAIAQQTSNGKWFSYSMMADVFWNTADTPKELATVKLDAYDRARDALERANG